jgi:hypothetical protein
MSFIFGILFFILFIGLFILLAVLGFLRSIFNFGRRKQTHHYEEPQSFRQESERTKIFDKKDGEYVDFEEVDEKE